MPIKPLSVDQVRRKASEASIQCKTTEELSPLEQIIGQERAVRALEFGLGIQEVGYNMYVAGMPGTGRKTAVKGYLEDIAKTMPVPSDWVYVYNFADPYKPNAIRLPAGRGRIFVADLDNLIEEAKQRIPKVIESDDFNRQRENILKVIETERSNILNIINQKARSLGFNIQSTQVGFALIPIVDGKPITPEQFAKLDEETKDRIKEGQEKIAKDIRQTQRQLHALEQKAREALAKLGQNQAIQSIANFFTDLNEKYKDVDEVKEHLDFIKKDIAENLELFLGKSKTTGINSSTGIQQERALRRYKANLIVDHTHSSGAPVVLEENPTYKNLFGFLEREAVLGTLFTDFTLIHGGALHQANGGFLVIPIEDALRNPLVYDGLKRAIRNQKIEIEDIGERLGYLTTKTLAPEPIPLKTKIILIGNPHLYQQLYILDPDFRELFKVKADFDITMDWNNENIQLYASFVCSVCKKENLLHLDRGALSKLLEYSARLASSQRKLSTQFGAVADVIREANYYAKKDNTGIVTAEHIKKAIDEKFYRSNLIQSKILESIKDDTIKISVTGEQIGQVNGLSVITLGDIMFGQPSRVSASVALGREGIVNIEREAELSGAIHTKGVLILNGFLADNFAQDYPLTLSARLVFEQSYGMVDGDSASSTELYALLSRLSEVPIKQHFAVTGSINQKGEIQAIGGVNQKIEGFFEVCKLKG
ncbi:MAG: Lon protease family protein [Candidatus Ranarchaeia archaeon]